MPAVSPTSLPACLACASKQTQSLQQHLKHAQAQSSVTPYLVQVLSGISKSKSVVPTAVEFVDIAGLVKGASKGEGLGNQFLANIRECDSIVQARSRLRARIGLAGGLADGDASAHTRACGALALLHGGSCLGGLITTKQ